MNSTTKGKSHIIDQQKLQSLQREEESRQTTIADRYKAIVEKIKENSASSDIGNYYNIVKAHQKGNSKTKTNYYRPLKPHAKRSLFGAYDIETKPWVDDAGNWHDARDISDPDKCFSFGSVLWYDDLGEHSTYEKRIFFDRKEMAYFMLSEEFANYSWWGFNSGKFDLFILYSTDILDSAVFDILFRTNSVIQLTYLGAPYGEVEPDKPYKVYFNDLRLITGGSLKKVGKSLHLQKLENEKREGGFGSEITDEDIEYNIRDSEIVLIFVKELEDLVNERFHVSLRPTVSSLSSSIYRTNYFGKLYGEKYEKGMRINKYDAKFRDSYYGGRTEVYDHRGEELDTICFDINSLYPYVMQKYSYPDPSKLRYYRHLPRTWKSMMGMVKATVYVPECDYPVLPYKTSQNKLIFPTGKFTGSWNVPELVYAMKYGATIVKVFYGILSPAIQVFEDFVVDLYTLRKQFDAQDDTLRSYIVKILLNSSYGKFAQKIKHQKFGYVDDKRIVNDGNWYVFTDNMTSDFGTWVEIDDHGKMIEEDSPSDVICWASNIASYARIELHKAIMRSVNAGCKVLYSDTDSIFVLNADKLSEAKRKEVYQLGNWLGQAKVEHKGLTKFYAPKVYWVDEQEGYVDKHKGIPSNFNFEKGVNFHRGEKTAREDTEIEKSKHHGFLWDEATLKERGVNMNYEDVRNFFGGSFVRINGISDLVRNNKPLGSITVTDRHISGVDEKRKWVGSRGRPWSIMGNVKFSEALSGER